MANWLSGYTTRKKITIDKSKIDSDLTDFPVLVKLTSSNFDFSKANSDGFDLRFTSSDGTTLLKYERERHDSDNEVAEYWVKIPSISSSEDTIFYIYYRTEDTADGADPTNVWDSNFKGVWHMKDLTTSTIEDSTSNNNDGTKKAANEPTQADGKIAKAQSFSGDDWIDVNSVSIYQQFTIEAWVKVGLNQEGVIYGADGSILLNAKYNNHFTSGTKAGSICGGAWNSLLESTTTASADVWYKVAITRDSSKYRYSIWVNGVEENYKTESGTIPSCSYGRWLGVGQNYAGTKFGYLSGTLDEVRISDTARSAAWIKASYNSENNSLVSYGNEEGIDNAVFFGCNF